VRPDVVLGFGGYSSFPTVMAASWRGVPAMIHEQNAVPGMANKVLAVVARRVAVGFKDALARFPRSKGVWTGNPVRPLDEGVPSEQARREFGLAPDKSTVLVFGGSQGSRILNTEAAAVLAGMDVQVIHITGNDALQQVAQVYRATGVACVVQAYMDRIGLAYAAADLVIGRAGAGTVTELGVLGVPAVLIPYPGANDHQKYNARVLERLGMAVIIEEKSLRQDILRDKIFSILKQGSFRVEDHERSKDEFVTDGASRLCDELLRDWNKSGTNLKETLR
jgi:UDP-N-acetylglucosamine--N-acetylmuramyl-(pentapeptide) pyrophosphoryl-undecaprenol N-acetylglucosamine transferase